MAAAPHLKSSQPGFGPRESSPVGPSPLQSQDRVANGKDADHHEGWRNLSLSITNGAPPCAWSGSGPYVTPFVPGNFTFCCPRRLPHCKCTIYLSQAPRVYETDRRFRIRSFHLPRQPLLQLPQTFPRVPRIAIKKNAPPPPELLQQPHSHLPHLTTLTPPRLRLSQNEGLHLRQPPRKPPNTPDTHVNV